MVRLFPETHQTPEEKEARAKPDWPQIRNDGITAGGFGDRNGDKPCFCTRANNCDLYIPHSLTKDEATARAIFEQIMPTIMKMWSEGCGNRYVTVEVNEERWELFLEFAFSHILIHRER
ncbi:MAG: hypothetical protein ABSF55_02405 [Candidatus Staskawiczbacteria bacterium]|jgi:hypothetical protein